jgi:resuscitation-promoting factor RpfA
MRLVCPNCEAKYEVPEDAIPETGRDVQCANCGHAWYQMRPRAAGAEAAPVAATATAAPSTPEPVVQAQTMTEASVAPEVTAPVPEPAGTVEVASVVAEAAPAPDAPVAAADVPSDFPPAGMPAAAEAPVEAAVEAVVTAVAGAGMPMTGTVTETVSEAVVESVSGAVSETVAAVVAPVEAAVQTLQAAAEDAGLSQVARAVTGDAAESAAPVVAEPLAAAAGLEATSPVPDAAPAAYAVDDSVLAILREEAEREAQARRVEDAKPLEVQADLGIDAAMPAARKPVEVISSEPVSPAGVDDAADDRLSARRSRLPDVEEINSTLRPGEQSGDEASADAMLVPVEGRSSFRSGFMLVLTLAILGAALYVSADALANAVPALAGVLKAYVGFVDSLRLQLDGLMQSATVAINGE